MGRILFVLILLLTLCNCSKRSYSSFGLRFIEPISQDGSPFDRSSIKACFDTLFYTDSRTQEFEAYRMTISNSYVEDIFLVYPDRVVSYNQNSDGKEYFLSRKVYDASFRKVIVEFMDSVFWSEPNKDNTSMIHDGTIMEVEGVRGDRHQKILRKTWSAERNMLLLEDFFTWY